MQAVLLCAQSDRDGQEDGQGDSIISFSSQSVGVQHSPF